MMESFAVIVKKSIHHEGDERARTNPGHGYPAYTEDFKEFIPMNSLIEVEQYVLKHDKDTFTIIQYKELAVIKTVKIALTAKP